MVVLGAMFRIGIARGILDDPFQNCKIPELFPGNALAPALRGIIHPIPNSGADD
jgi:hypothetical protein